MKNLIIGMVAALGISLSASAQLTFIGGSDPAAIPGNNDVETVLTTLGLTDFVSGRDVRFDANGQLDLFFLGSESGFINSVEIDGEVVFTENPDAITSDPFVSDFIATITITEGDLFSDLGISFSSNRGTPAAFGDAGFGQFFNPQGGNRFAVGFGDNTGDGDFDDLVFPASFTSAVPEPATWLMMIFGFAGVGLMAQRRRKALIA